MHDCVPYAAVAQCGANLLKRHTRPHRSQLSYRDYNRTIESETGSINVPLPRHGNRGRIDQSPRPEKKKENNGTKGAA